MKKLKYLGVLCFSLLLLTGCGKSENATEVLETSGKKMSELTNYAVKLEMKIGVKAEGMEMTIPMVIDAKIDEKSGIGKMNTSIKMLGMDFSTEEYTQTIDGKTTTYTKGNYEVNGEQVWTKETEENKMDYKQFIAITENSKKVEKKKSDDKNTNYYQVTVAKEQMQSLLNESSSLTGDSMDTESYEIQGDVVIDVYVDKTTQYITKISMNLKDAIKINEEETQAELNEFTMTLTFSEFDKVGTLTIPDDVIQSAIERSDDDFGSEDDWNFDESGIDNPEM